MKTEGFHAKIRCNLNDISYLSETQKNNFQFLNKHPNNSNPYSIKTTMESNELSYPDFIGNFTYKYKKIIMD